MSVFVMTHLQSMSVEKAGQLGDTGRKKKSRLDIYSINGAALAAEYF
jgi:hypothetical protein